MFVVAIGTDYNILMTTRLREEMQEGKDPRAAAELAVEQAGPTVVSAGVILAGTFASLGLTGISLLVQIGATIAIGVILVSFVMATVLVPSLSALIEKRVWWPGHQDAVKPSRPATIPAPGRVAAASPCPRASASQVPQRTDGPGGSLTPRRVEAGLATTSGTGLTRSAMTLIYTQVLKRSAPVRGPSACAPRDKGSAVRAWSVYGAQRAQSAATGNKWSVREIPENKPNPLPWVATGCRRRQMVRRGSTVRVRQRADLKYLHIGTLTLSVRQTRGHIPDTSAVRATHRDVSRPLPTRPR